MHLIACDQCGKRIAKTADHLEVGLAIHHANGAISGHPGDPAHLHADCVPAYVKARIETAAPDAE